MNPVRARGAGRPLTYVLADPRLYPYENPGTLPGVEATNERRRVPSIEPVAPENAPEGSRPLMEQGAQSAGKMLNFYKEFAVSLTAFEGYMNLNATLNGGALDRRMQESIAVAVSDFNGCDY